jgi:hypothetical protein
LKKPRSYVVNCALACGVLYWAQSLSSSGRSTIDWIVMSVIALAILWNLFKLGQRLFRAGGGKAVWHLQRTLLLWIIGLLNTMLIRPAEIGSWKNLVGWALLVAAVVDTIMIYQKEQASVAPLEATKPEGA